MYASVSDKYKCNYVSRIQNGPVLLFLLAFTVSACNITPPNASRFVEWFSTGVCRDRDQMRRYSNIIKNIHFPVLIFVIDDDYYRAYRVATKALKKKLRTSLIGHRP